MPNSTQSTSQTVVEIIERDGVIRNGLARGLINVRGLARYIQVTMHEEATFESIVSAIRRYPVKEDAARHQAVGKYLTKISMKNKIVDVEILNAPEIPAALAKFSAEVDYGRGETLSIVSGIRRVRVVIDSKNLDKLTAVVPKKDIMSIMRNLAEVMLELSEKVVKVPGVVATISTELAMNGINILEYIHCTPDAIIVVDEKDGLKTYQVLQKLSEVQT